MNFLATIILPYLLLYKYWAIFGITFVAALALPIPPGTLLMASSAFASQGYFSFGYVVLYGALGNILGDNLGYWLARIYGHAALRKIGFKRILDSDRYRGIERRVKERPGVFIFLSRFEVFSNLSVNLIAGLGKVPYPTYLLYEIIGEGLQVAIYSAIGYFFGDNWQTISAILSNFFMIILLLLILITIIFWKKIKAWISPETPL